MPYPYPYHIHARQAPGGDDDDAPPGGTTTNVPNRPTSSSTPVVTRTTPTTTTRPPTSSPTVSRPTTTTTTTTTTTSSSSVPFTVGSPTVNTIPGSQTTAPVIPPPGGLDTTSTPVMPPSFAINPPSNTAPTDPDAKGGLSTTTLIGIGAGGLLAVVLVVAGVMFALRRLKKKREASKPLDFDIDSNRNSFRRQSMLLPEDSHSNAGYSAASSGGGRRGPRPPTMIERRQAGGAGVGAGYGRGPGAPPQAYGHGGYPGYPQQGYSDYAGSDYDHQSQYAAYGAPHGGHGHGIQAPAPVAYHDSPMASPIHASYADASHAPAFVNHQVGRRGSDGSYGGEYAPQPQRRMNESPQPMPMYGGAPVPPVGPGGSYTRLERQPAHPQQHPHPHQQRQSIYDENDAYGGI